MFEQFEFKPDIQCHFKVRNLSLNVYSQTFVRRGIKAYSLKMIKLQFSGEDDDFSAALCHL